MTTQAKKTHVTVLMTPEESAELTRLRARIELTQSRRLSTSQVLREAIQQAHESIGKSDLVVERPETPRTERFDLIVDADLRTAVDALFARHEGAEREFQLVRNDVIMAALQAATEGAKNVKAKRTTPRSR